MTKRKPEQKLLGLVAPARRSTSLADRGYGTTETPHQRTVRLARERALHEQTKANADAAAVLAAVRLRRMAK